MEFKIGKFYRTRDGRKAYLFNKKDGGIIKHNKIKYFIAIENDNVYQIYENGRSLSGKEHGFDIVDIWREPSGKRVRLRERILKMLSEGKSYTEIHKETGAAHSTIARARKIGGYKTARYNKIETMSKYKELLEQQLSLNEIAKRLKKSYKAVCWYIYSTPELRELKIRYDKRYNNLTK